MVCIGTVGHGMCSLQERVSNMKSLHLKCNVHDPTEFSSSDSKGLCGHGLINMIMYLGRVSVLVLKPALSLRHQVIAYNKDCCIEKIVGS